MRLSKKSLLGVVFATEEKTAAEKNMSDEALPLQFCLMVFNPLALPLQFYPSLVLHPQARLVSSLLGVTLLLCYKKSTNKVESSDHANLQGSLAEN